MAGGVVAGNRALVSKLTGRAAVFPVEHASLALLVCFGCAARWQRPLCRLPTAMPTFFCGVKAWPDLF
jgi:hypothetical protein